MTYNVFRGTLSLTQSINQVVCTHCGVVSLACLLLTTVLSVRLSVTLVSHA